MMKKYLTAPDDDRLRARAAEFRAGVEPVDDTGQLDDDDADAYKG